MSARAPRTWILDLHKLEYTALANSEPEHSLLREAKRKKHVGAGALRSRAVQVGVHVRIVARPEADRSCPVRTVDQKRDWILVPGRQVGEVHVAEMEL